MTRVGKYMVYNPRKDKPVKYYDYYFEAHRDALLLNEKEQTDILILKVVANIENNAYKILHSEHNRKGLRKFEIIED